MTVANRNGAAIEYVWTVKSRPAASKAAVSNPEGVVTMSRHWEYAYQDGSVPSFTADVDEVQIVALVGTAGGNPEAYEVQALQCFATGGVFFLTFRGYTTAPIAWNAM